LRTRGTWWLVRNGLPRITHFLFKITPPPPIPPGGGVFIIVLGGSRESFRRARGSGTLLS